MKIVEEIMADCLPSLMKDINTQSQETEQTPNKIKPKKSMPRHIIIKLLRTREQPEKNDTLTTGEKWFKWLQISHQKQLRPERSGHFFFKGYKEKNCQPSILYLTKILFRNKGEIKTFSNEGTLREFIASRNVLKAWLKEVLATERKGNFEHQKEGKSKGKSKTMGKYNRQFFSWVL